MIATLCKSEIAWVRVHTCQCLRMRFVGIKDVVSQATPFNLGEKAVVERVGSRDRCGGGKTLVDGLYTGMSGMI